MVGVWTNIEKRRTEEGYKALRQRKANKEGNYETSILQIAEENIFLAARVLGFIDPLNEKLRSLLLRKATEIVRNTRKGEAFVWAAHLFEYYRCLNLLADLLDVNLAIRKRLYWLHELGSDRPLEYFYNILINYSKDKETIELLQKIANDRDIYLDDYEYNTLIAQAATFEEAKGLFEEMKSKNIQPNEISYNTLINKSESFADAKFFFQEMKDANLRPNEISYNTLINKSESFADAKFFFQEMKNANLRPNEISYSTLINKAQTFEQQKPFYLDFLKLFPLKKGNFKTEKNYNFLFTALFKKVRNKEHFAFVQSEIYRLGLKMDNYTQSFYNTLQKKYS
ncbi:MAG: hypothetical protein EAZ97_04785 [Bacteroidetes bacterium]|nr:MAG: hypothetical protein EAZ97_04785 [Bacteroidota bacterium]